MSLTPTARAALQRTRDLFASNPDSWVQGYWAKNAAGGGCDETSAEAVCFCLEGALRHFIDTRTKWLDYSNAMSAIRAHITRYSVLGWNDVPGRTREEVIAKLDEVLKDPT